MADGADVLTHLIPTGGWIITGDDFDSIQWITATPITKAEFKAGFAKADAAKVAQEAKEAQALETAQAKLAALGLTAADLKALGL